MKTADFERILKNMGFALVRNNGHSVWSNGKQRVAIPHGREMNRMIVRRLLKDIGYSVYIPEIDSGLF